MTVTNTDTAREEDVEDAPDPEEDELDDLDGMVTFTVCRMQPERFDRYA